MTATISQVVSGVSGITASQTTALIAQRTEPVQRPYRIAAFGDSRASFMGTSTLLAVTGTANYTNPSRAAHWLAAALGDAELVANFGVGGDTATLWDSTSRANSKLIRNLISASLFKGGPVDAVYVQYGINDFISGTSAATVVAALKACLGALMASGMKVIFESTQPASAANYGASAAAKLQATIDSNTAMQEWLASFPRQAVFVNTFYSLVDETGYASVTYIPDGTHEGPLGAKLSGEACAVAARTLLPQKQALVYTSGSLLQPNLIDWGAPTTYTASDIGTVTFSAVTWNTDTTTGMPYAEVTATCGVLSAGRALGHLEISATSATGATPRFPLAIGDELQGSAYVVIDDGAGGVAPVQAAPLRMRAYFDTKYADSGAFIGAAGATFTTPIAHRFTTPTIVTATASGAIVNTASGGLQLQQSVEFNTVGQVARIRVYVPSIRVVSPGIQPSSASIPASAVAYTNTTGAPGTLYIGGGTITAITIARQGTQFATGQTAGAFRLAQNDSVTMTYAVAPTTFTFVPDTA